MAKFIYGHTGYVEITDFYHITGVVFPELTDRCRATPQPEAKVTFHNAKDGSSFTLPVSMSSLALLPCPQQQALEARAAKDAQEIDRLRRENKAEQALLQFTVNDWKRHSDKQAAEVKRLETVCYEHWDAKCDTEKKWAAEASEHDNTKNQLREVRTANSQLLNANTCQASKIQALESQLNLLKHQYEGKCQTVRELRATGSAKERDEYSKALDQLRAAKDTKVSQITKQAGEWKQTATTRAKEMDRLAELVLERTKELAQCQRENRNLRVANSMTASGPCNTKPVVTDMSLPTRIKTLETRVTKLEEAEGFPMESFTGSPGDSFQFLMGGEWLPGFLGFQRTNILSMGHNKSLSWDLANQPTRWKPMPK